MKNKIICITLILSTLFSFKCFAAGDPIVSYTKTSEGQDTYVVDGKVFADFHEATLESFEKMVVEKTYLEIFAGRAEESCKIAIRRGKEATAKKILADFTDDLFDKISNEVDDEAAEYKTTPSTRYSDGNGGTYSVGSGAKANIYYHVRYKDDEGKWRYYTTIISVGSYIVLIESDLLDDEIRLPIKDGASIADWIVEHGKNDFTGFETRVFDADNPEIRGKIKDYTPAGSVSFDFIVPDDWTNGITREVADKGTKAECVLTAYTKSSEVGFALKVTGNLGEVTFFKKTYSNNFAKSIPFSNCFPGTFGNTCRVENETIVDYIAGIWQYGSYAVELYIDADKLNKVTLNSIPCTNLSYTPVKTAEKTEEDKNNDKEKQDDKDKQKETEKQDDKDKQQETEKPKDETDKDIVKEPSETKEDNKNDVPAEENKTASKPKFTDVPQEHWAYAEVTELADEGVILGYGDGKFGADDSVTYEQLSLLLKRLFNYDETNTQPTAAKREDIITALVKALGADVSSVDENVINQKFSDGETIKDDNRKYIAYAVNSKLAVGYGGKLYTDSNVTRAETAVLLSRAVELNK